MLWLALRLPRCWSATHRLYPPVPQIGADPHSRCVRIRFVEFDPWDTCSAPVANLRLCRPPERPLVRFARLESKPIRPYPAPPDNITTIEQCSSPGAPASSPGP